MTIHPSAAGRNGRDWDWTVLLLIAAGAVLRFLALDQQSYWVDEIRSVLTAAGGSESNWAYSIWNIHGPLHLVLLRLWMFLFGEGEAATRILSVLFGVAALPLFYRAALPLIGRRAARFALVMLVFSPFHLWYSQETRNYAMLFDIVLVAVPLYVAELERQSRGSMLAALAISVAGCLTNLTGFFLLGVYGFLALTLGRKHRYPIGRMVFLGVLTAVVLAPWWVRAVTQLGTPHLGRAGLSGKAIVHGESPAGLLSVPFAFYTFSVGFSSGPSIHELKQDQWQALAPHLPYLIPMMALFLGTAAYGAWSLRHRRSTVILFGIWLLVPLMLMGAFALFNLKAPNPRYALASFVPYLMLLGLGAASLRWRASRAAVLALLLFISARADYEYFTNPRYWRPDGRSVGALLTAEHRSGDVVFSCGVPEPLEYYAPSALPIVPRPAPFSFGRAGKARAWAAETASGYERVWYVKINSFWGDLEFRLLHACEELLIADGRWEFEKSLVARFVVPPDSVSASDQRSR